MEKILLTDAEGEEWVFTCDEANRLCYIKNGAPRQILLNDVTAEFDIITDKNGFFHLVIQDMEGNLLYLTYNFREWKKYVILKSKSNKNSMKGFKLIMTEDNLHCFYGLTVSGKSMLIHHILNKTVQPSTPEAISYIPPSGGFSCAGDINGDIHIFYFDEGEAFRYKLLKNDFFEDRMLAVEDNITSINSASDGDIHMVFTANMKNYCSLIYYNLTAKERKVISFSDSRISDICIQIKGSSIIIQWRERAEYYQCISDDGTDFKKPTLITFPRNKRAEILRLRYERNPLMLYGDRCIITSQIQTSSANKEKHRHTSAKADYNIKSGDSDDEISKLRNMIRENTKEISRLSTAINGIWNKINEITKKVTDTPKAHIGEVNQENFELFTNTAIDDLEFENSKIFDKE